MLGLSGLPVEKARKLGGLDLSKRLVFRRLKLELGYIPIEEEEIVKTDQKRGSISYFFVRTGKQSKIVENYSDCR